MSDNLGLEYLSPREPIGLLILIIGIFFTVGIFYIFINLDKESYSEKARKTKEQQIQANKIKRLYPPKDSE